MRVLTYGLSPHRDSRQKSMTATTAEIVGRLQGLDRNGGAGCDIRGWPGMRDATMVDAVCLCRDNPRAAKRGAFAEQHRNFAPRVIDSQAVYGI